MKICADNSVGLDEAKLNGQHGHLKVLSHLHLNQAGQSKEAGDA